MGVRVLALPLKDPITQESPPSQLDPTRSPKWARASRSQQTMHTQPQSINHKP